MKTIQQWSLLFAGALAGVIGSFISSQHECWILEHQGLFYAFILLFVLLILGAIPFQFIFNRILMWLGKKRPYIGILSDMGWDEKRPSSQFATGTSITIQEWIDQLKKDTVKNKRSIQIGPVSSKDNFYRYTAILNPYGGVYPEEDIASEIVLGKIFDYVSKGGIFVNVADVPGFWAYSLKLERKSGAGKPIRIVKEDSGSISVNTFSIVALAPFVQKLWLNVNPHEKEEKVLWKNTVKHGTERFAQEISNMKIHRIAVVERNVDPILVIANTNSADESELTPLFFAVYDNGRFLISLLFQDVKENPNNQKVKEILSLVLIQAIK